MGVRPELLMDKIRRHKSELRVIKATRNNAIDLQSQIAELDKQKSVIVSQLQKIQKGCTHEIGVKLQDYNFDDAWNEAFCLKCNTHFCGPFLGFDSTFKSIIHLSGYDFNGLEFTKEEKVEIALGMFEQERELRPDLNNSEIVEIINKKIKENKISVEQSGFVKTIGKKQN